MKKYLLLFIPVFLASLSSLGQGIEFAFSDLEKAKTVAAERDKLIFIDIYAAWCGPCKAMEEVVFKKEEVASYFNSTFVNFKIDSDLDNGRALAIAYGLKEFPTFLFLNADGEIIHKIIGYHSPTKLLAEAKKAKRKKNKFIPLSSLDSRYKNGETEPAFLYSYLKRKSFEQGSQPAILNTYLDAVSNSELRTEKVLTLISDNVTSIKSKGFSILAESLNYYSSMTKQQQKSILQGISNAKRTTFRAAIKQKDDELFDALIKAVHATSYSMDAAYAEERQFRYDFAKHTKNFKHFKLIAQEEAGQIMTKTPEELTAQSERTIEEFKQNLKKRGLSSSTSQYKVMLAGMENGATKAASFQLNDFAWGYYQMATADADLRNALKWSAYAIKLEETPTNYETYAFLLKKLGRNRDAKKAMKHGIKLAKNLGVDSKTLKGAFLKIKKK